MKKKNRKEQVNNNLTEVVFILDKSGSMSGFEADTIGGFNSTIERHRSENSRTLVSTILFNDACSVIHDRVDIVEIKPLTKKEYCVGGCTAMFDAIGLAIQHIGNVHKYARKEDVPNNTVFVIITDGMENASCIFTGKEVKAKIKRQQEEHGWEFIFLGANIDSAETAESIGIRRERAVDYHQDKEGFEASFLSVSDALESLSMNCNLSNDWRRALDTDNERRK